MVFQLKYVKTNNVENRLKMKKTNDLKKRLMNPTIQTASKITTLTPSKLNPKLPCFMFKNNQKL